MASLDRRFNGRWQARYSPAPGATQITRTFSRKADATRWLTEQTAALAGGRHIHPGTAELTVGEWCDQWMAGYGTRRPSTVRQALVHLVQAAQGDAPPATCGEWCTEAGDVVTTEASTSNRMSREQLEATLWRAAHLLRGPVDPGVKRAVRRQVDGWWLKRDNRVVGTDPWSFGEVADVDVSGVVRLRLWPRPGRTGDGSFCGWVDRRNP